MKWNRIQTTQGLQKGCQTENISKVHIFSRRIEGPRAPLCPANQLGAQSGEILDYFVALALTRTGSENRLRRRRLKVEGSKRDL